MQTLTEKLEVLLAAEKAGEKVEIKFRDNTHSWFTKNPQAAAERYLTCDIHRIDPHRELKEALAAGKVIQWKYQKAPDISWEDCPSPGWNRDCQYRIKPEQPWSLKSHILQHFSRYLEGDEQWHKKGWTEDMLEGGWRPLLNDEIGSYQWSYDRLNWNEGKLEQTPAGPGVNFNRTKRPLPTKTPETDALIVELSTLASIPLNEFKRQTDDTPIWKHARRLELQRNELREALKPFAKYACDLLCGCHNCTARQAITNTQPQAQ